MYVVIRIYKLVRILLLIQSKDIKILVNYFFIILRLLQLSTIFKKYQKIFVFTPLYFLINFDFRSIDLSPFYCNLENTRVTQIINKPLFFKNEICNIIAYNVKNMVCIKVVKTTYFYTIFFLLTF